MAGPRSAPRRPAAGATPGAGEPSGLAARRRGRLRALPSVDEVVRALDGRPATSRPRVVDAVRAVLAERRRAVLAAASPAELDALTLETPALLPRVRAALDAAGAWGLDRVVNATGVVLHTNLGRAPLGRAALARLALVAARYSNLELDVRTKARGLPLRARGRPPLPPVRGRGLARGQQQRRGRLARARVARAGPRGRGVAGRADRDRRRLPDPGHHGPVRGPAGRGRDDEPDAPRRLRERDHAGDRAPPQGASVELPGSGLHGERPHRGARRAGPGARRSGARGSRLRLLPRPPAVGPSARAHGAGDGRAPAPTWSPSPATSSSGARRPGSSWAASALVERSARRTRSTGRSGSTSSPWRRSRRRCGRTRIRRRRRARSRPSAC